MQKKDFDKDLMDVVAVYDQMDPEALRTKLTQIPDLVKTAYSFFAAASAKASEALEDNSESVKESHKRCDQMIEWLTSMDGQEMTFEERKFVVENMRWVIEKDQEITNENQYYLNDTVTTIGKYALVGTLILLFGIGVTRHFIK